MKPLHPISTNARAPRRGSTFLLVLSVLAVALLISTTLTYTSRVDLLASRNFSDFTRSRLAVNSGLPAAAPFLRQFSLATATTQLWAEPFGSLPPTDPSLQAWSQRQHGGRLNGNASPVPRISQDLVFVDTSGKLNLNAAGSLAGWNARVDDRSVGLHPHDLRLEKFLTYALAEAGTPAGVHPGNLAKSLLTFRYGLDAKPGTGGLDDNADGSAARPETDGVDNNADGVVDDPAEAELAPENLDQLVPWTKLSRTRVPVGYPMPLLALDRNGVDDTGGSGTTDPSGEAIDDPADARIDMREPPAGDDVPYLSIPQVALTPGMTPEALAAMLPHIATFSVSRNAIGHGDGALNRLNLTTADVEVIAERLRTVYAETLPERQIVQIAANIADRRDPDRVRTKLIAKDGSIVLGLERVPFITEVYPDARTPDEDGDDGQFLELSNPWPESITLNGWRLDVAGTSIPLNTVMPPRGTIVVTDDYNDANDEDVDQDSAERIGSLFGIFGVVSAPPTRQVIEIPNFTLPNQTGAVRLFDQYNELVDEFLYTGNVEAGTSRSFQRLHPGLHETMRKAATPLAWMPETLAKIDAPTWTQMAASWDQLFQSVGDVVALPCGYVAQYEAAANGSLDQLDRLWAYPVLRPGVDHRVGVDDDVVTAGLSDWFYVGRPTIITRSTRTSNDRWSVVAEVVDAPYRHGLININTATLPVLMALPGMEEVQARRILEYRAVIEADSDAADEGAMARVPFANISDLLTIDEIWPKQMDLAERLDVARRYMNLVTVSSASFDVTSLYMERHATSREVLRRQAARSLLALDRPHGQIVTFDYLE